jgi:predicted porin
MCHVHGVFPLCSLLRSAFLILLGTLLTVCVQAQQPPAGQSVPTTITCISKQGERQVCKADTTAGVVLVRSVGESECLLGKTWGYDDTGVWVANGCGGEFGVGKQEASGASKIVGMFSPYGSLRTHVAAFNDDLEVQDNATRVGINFATMGKIKVIAGTEWGVNLVQSETQFNLSGVGPGDLGVVSTQTNPVFLARLGFVGVDFGPFGRVAIGKQNAVHYDIASYTTDRFNVFGGQGSSSYVAGTDGGVTGTGRADRVVNYRNTLLKILEIGVQGQFRAAGNETTTDGVGGSVQLTVLPGLKAGGSYTRTNWSPAQQALIRGLGGNADYMALGTRLDWRVLELGLVYSHQHNGDVVQVPLASTPNANIPVAFDSNGGEVYARAGLKKFGLIGGFIYQDPKVRDPLLNPDFRNRYLILGAEWFFAKNGKVYTESKIDIDSVGPTGGPVFNVFTIGFRYDFSWRISHEP